MTSPCRVTELSQCVSAEALDEVAAGVPGGFIDGPRSRQAVRCHHWKLRSGLRQSSAQAVAFLLSPQPFGDAPIGTEPEAIHNAAEVGSDLRPADHQHYLIVLMGRTWAPIQVAVDDGLAIDRGELLVQLAAAGKLRIHNLFSFL